MGKKYLIDTNILIEYVAGLLPDETFKLVDTAIKENFNISVINRIEILGHESVTPDVVDFLELSNQLELTSVIVDQTIAIRKLIRIKLPDAIIAATAIVNDFTLISRNTKDFKNVADLKLLNPHIE